MVDIVIHATVYSQPTDSHIYLQADSCHHLPSILGIQKGVALRLRRICSTDEEFNNKSKEYKAYLMNTNKWAYIQIGIIVLLEDEENKQKEVLSAQSEIFNFKNLLSPDTKPSQKTKTGLGASLATSFFL